MTIKDVRAVCNEVLDNYDDEQGLTYDDLHDLAVELHLAMQDREAEEHKE